jgi:hypothetical protein
MRLKRYLATLIPGEFPRDFQTFPNPAKGVHCHFEPFQRIVGGTKVSSALSGFS